mmetsp:Transcript_70705/g.147247  ORF Transcript_70705/g.147247 Transcript_70705/m.147247 type:complete len:200 (+) Transcript_70705:1023-1622(+)
MLAMEDSVRRAVVLRSSNMDSRRFTPPIACTRCTLPHRLGGSASSVRAASRLPGRPFSLRVLRAALEAASADRLTASTSAPTSSRYRWLAARMCSGSTYPNSATVPAPPPVAAAPAGSGSAVGRTMVTTPTSARLWSAGTASRYTVCRSFSAALRCCWMACCKPVAPKVTASAMENLVVCASASLTCVSARLKRATSSP